MRLLSSYAFVMATIVALSPTPSLANLVGYPSEVPAIEAAQQQVLNDNPDLQDLAAIAPWALRAVLAKLEKLPQETGNAPRGFDGLDAYAVDILNRNPALMIVYQSSPEASLELLALIKAAGAGK